MPQIRWRTRRLTTPALALLVVSVLSQAGAAELRVPQAYPTVQAAVDAAADGDTVLIADGTYSGEGNYNISTLGKAVTITSVNGPGATVLDANALGRLFVITAGEGRATVIAGLTLRNAFVEDMYEDGGAIVIRNSSPVIDNCRLIANNLSGSFCGGAGIGINGGSPLIRNCSFEDNVDVSALGDGGGLFARLGARVEVTGCQFLRNTGSTGGGLAAYGAEILVANSYFYLNQSTSG